jgi:alpha-N-acetylglucosaminidase
MTLIDYVCEQHELYKKTSNFYGAPFLWSYVGNFGGTTFFYAPPLAELAGKVTQALAVANCDGVASVPEGIDCNPAIYEMLFEQPWHPQGALDDQAWIAEYATWRAGRDDPQVVKAWEILRSQVLSRGPGLHSRGSGLTKNPFTMAKMKPLPKTALAGVVGGRPPELQPGLVAAIDALLAAAPESQRADGYQFDLVNWVRQVLAYHTDTVFERIDQARKLHDQPELERQTRLMLDILRDMDELTGSRHEFLLGRWIRDARAWGIDPAESDYYEHNARQILTAWAGGLRDYARREWNGLLRDYYLQRWEVWAMQNAPAALENRPVDEKRADFVLLRDGDYAVEPGGNPIEVARRIFTKYRAELIKSPGERSEN